MKENLTLVAWVLDRSSSMMSVKNATINGFNEYIEKQKSEPGECLFSLFTFANQTTQIYNAIPVQSVPMLTGETYNPYGSTALLDAIGITIDSIGSKLSAMKEEDRPANVLVLIQTDGEENRSQEYSKSKIRSMIEHQRNKYNWDFVFMGANENAIMTAANYGIQDNMATAYNSNDIGTKQLFGSLSAGTSRYRGKGGQSLTRSNGFFS
jgi:hypothetical protein